MATDQNQSRMKPRIWLATGSRAKLGADRSPQERPGGLTGQGMSLTGPVRSAGSSGLSQGGFHGARSPARPPAASARALYS